MTDYYTYNQSMESQKQEFLFENRQYLNVTDNSGGTYPNGSITWDCAAISNSDRLIDWSQSFVQIPLVVQFGPLPLVADGNSNDAFAVCMKNHCHLIDSMSIQLSNYDTANLTSMSNLDINYKILSEWDYNTLETLGPSVGYYKDSAAGIRYQGAAGKMGVGETNNYPVMAGFNGGLRYLDQSYNRCNEARVKRMNDTSFNLIDNPYVIAEADLGESSKNYYKVLTTGAGINYLTYYVMATIPLKQIHDVFQKLPLCRGSFLKLTLNTNANSSVDIAINAAGTALSYSNPTTVHGVFPVQLSPIDEGLINPAAAVTAKLTCAIGKGALTGATHPTFSQTRLYACSYVLAPSRQEEYLAQNAIKKVVYEDRMYSTILNIVPGGALNKIINQGISRIKSVLIVPMMSASTHGATAPNLLNTTGGAALGSVMTSPFSSAPSTTLPYVNVQQFNVLLSGNSHYQQNINYGWEQFLYEARSQSLNGGMSEMLSSGLLNAKDYWAGYGFIYVDFTRKASQGVDNVSKSVEIIGTNNTSCVVDYHCLITYYRDLSINCSTGQLVFNEQAV